MPSARVIGSPRSPCRWSIARPAGPSRDSVIAAASSATSSPCTAPAAADRVGRVILAIDQGKTGSTCLVFGEDGQIAGRAYSEFGQHFPRPGWVEHDATEIWEVTRRVGHEALADAGIDGTDLTGIGITNQRETVVGWDRETGEPI